MVKKANHKEKRERNKQARANQNKQQQPLNNDFKNSLIATPAEKLSEEDLDYLRRATTHPLNYAEFISQSNYGKKFQTLEQYQRFMNLIAEYEKNARQYMKATDLRGKELDIYTIKEMLKKGNLSAIDTMILQSNLPTEKERI